MGTPATTASKSKNTGGTSAAAQTKALKALTQAVTKLSAQSAARLEAASKLHNEVHSFTLTTEQIKQYCEKYDPKKGLTSEQLRTVLDGMSGDKKAAPVNAQIASAILQELDAVQQGQADLEVALKAASAAAVEAIEANAPAHAKVFRTYKAGVYKLAPNEGIWRTVVYGATGVIIIGLIAEGVGYTFGISWCRPSSLIS